MTKRDVVHMILRERAPLTSRGRWASPRRPGRNSRALRLRRRRRPLRKSPAEARQRHRFLHRPGQQPRAGRFRRRLGPQRGQGHRQRGRAACCPSRRWPATRSPTRWTAASLPTFPAKIARFPDRFRVFQIGFSLYERAWTLRGMENLMMDFYDHPQFVHELLAASPTTTSPRSARP